MSNREWEIWKITYFELLKHHGNASAAVSEANKAVKKMRVSYE